MVVTWGHSQADLASTNALFDAGSSASVALSDREKERRSILDTALGLHATAGGEPACCQEFPSLSRSFRDLMCASCLGGRFDLLALVFHQDCRRQAW